MPAPDLLTADDLGGPDPGATQPASFTDDTADASVVTPSASTSSPPQAAPPQQAQTPIQNGPGVWDSIRQALPLVMAGIAAKAGGPLAGAGLLKGLSDAQEQKRLELEKQAALSQAYTHQNVDDLIRLQQESGQQQAWQTTFVQNAIKELNGIDDPVQFAATAKLFDDTSARVFGTDPGTISGAVKFDNTKALAKTKTDAQAVLDRVGKQFASPDDPTGAQFIASHPDYSVTFQGKTTKFSDLQAVVGLNVTDTGGSAVAPSAPTPAAVSDAKSAAQSALIAEVTRRKSAGLPPMTPTEAAKISGDAATAFEANMAGKKKAAEVANTPQSPLESLMTDDALNRAADAYNSGQPLPNLGYGKDAAILRAKIMNRAAAKSNGNLALAGADFAANKSSLTAMQKNLDAVTAFENTAFANANQFLTAAQKVVDTGSPLLNQPLRSIDNKVFGNENVPVMMAARQVFSNEIAKITSNPTLSGQLSDAARAEVAAYNPNDATLGQIVGIVRLLKTDADNRKTFLTQQVNDIRNRIQQPGGGPTGAPAATPSGVTGTGKTQQVPGVNGVPITLSEQSDGTWTSPTGGVYKVQSDGTYMRIR